MAHVVHASREVAVVRAPSMPIHPVHAVFLAGVIPLFAGALLSDLAYFRTYEIQWQNFASWLLAGGLVMAGVALVFAFAGLAPARRTPARVLYLVVLAVTWIIGFFNALHHARDAWASMPAGLVMSVIITLLAIAAAWIAFCPPRLGEPR
ncbi:MAG: hypothetical protein GX761_09165 [Gammaproteobacteria bacterium]|uniref:DUF2231 domain-containing protein n=1 Tax=Luteimonas sp. JM171 TaxID=1896164 RepID=UPI00085572D7|nr:DUF2231 domain-containing protein [Luteimonas sp. JM171]AOH35839.1 hypothetical protein BGP89_05280 [Luteimonas sp. JM171]NLC61437.1 hypothetical protein [Gammaproteobacteria bacterium]